MFTGMVEEMGKVIALDAQGENHRLVIRAERTPMDLKVGDSVAVNGCCLTAISVSKDAMAFDLSPETLDRTRFAERLRPGRAVNLERPLRLSSPLDGHLVQGHVDGVASVTSVVESGSSLDIEFEVPKELARYCVAKGSIALDGVSLTCARVTGSSVAVAVIPHTRGVTTLGALSRGDLVNVEVDLIAKYVERLLPK